MTLFGPDGSAYQASIKLTEADAARIKFMLWRCIHQSGNPDTSYPKMRDWARARNIPFCAYVFLDDMPARVKADAAVAAINDPTIPVMVDHEDPTCSFANALAFVDEVRARGYRCPLYYSGLGPWAKFGRPTLAGHGFDLINARYLQFEGVRGEIAPRYKEMGGDTGRGWLPFGGLAPVMWQFGDKLHYGDTYMDMNAIRDPAVIGRCFKSWGSGGLIKDAPPPSLVMDQPVNADTLNRTRWLQQIMNERFGATLTVDGGFGAKTKAAVIVMQGVLKATPDGQYGPQTAAALAAWLDQH